MSQYLGLTAHDLPFHTDTGPVEEMVISVQDWVRRESGSAPRSPAVLGTSCTRTMHGSSPTYLWYNAAQLHPENIRK